MPHRRRTVVTNRPFLYRPATQPRLYHTDGIDWITVSPKTSRIALDRADELKIVFTGQDVDSWLHFDANHRYLQPCSCRNTPEVIQYILAHPEWSLSLQTHKYIDIP